MMYRAGEMYAVRLRGETREIDRRCVFRQAVAGGVAIKRSMTGRSVDGYVRVRTSSDLTYLGEGSLGEDTEDSVST